MKKSIIQTSRTQSPGSNSDGFGHHVQSQSIVVPSKQIAFVERFEKKEQSWFATSQVPTDLTIQVQNINFYVHKYPLISKSEYMSRIDLQSSNPDFPYNLKLENFPGGPETFETVLKFCYGILVDLTPTNVAPLRCASEFLQMTEEYEDGNLITRTEAFLTFIVLSSWRDSITVLKSCKSLSPWAENLHIVRRCSDSIASKAARENSRTREGENDDEWWFDDVCTLHIEHFVRFITAVRAKGSTPETIGACIVRYAEKWLPDTDEEVESQKGSFEYEQIEFQFSISSKRSEEEEEGRLGHNKEKRMMIELLVSILPPQKGSVPCKFLMWMLKIALAYSATPALVSELEKRVGMILQDASVDDLLIPNYTNVGVDEEMKLRIMHDVDVVQRMIEYFLMHEQQHEQKSDKLEVGKLLDGYLAEIARDPDLQSFKFQILSEALPENARTCHDGLYRAIDTYLKTHPALTEQDRRRLCKVMDCDKLSLDACVHAAHNERLPLRTIIQVLFSEQIKMREAIKGNVPMKSEVFLKQESIWSSGKNEIKTIKEELYIVKKNMTELQREYSNLKHEFEKLRLQRRVSSWSSGWKKIKQSGLFHGKVDNEEIEQNPISRRRRSSIS